MRFEITQKTADAYAAQIKDFILDYCREHHDEFLEYLQEEAAKGDKAAIAELARLRATEEKAV